MIAASYEAAERAGHYTVIENPTGAWLDLDLPTLEHAQAYALALNTWLDARPDPNRLTPFLSGAPDLYRDSPERLAHLIDRPWRYELA